MLYFKTKKGRLIIQIDCGGDELKLRYVYVLVSPGGDKSIYNYHIDYVNESIWKKFERKAIPNVLEENEVDSNAYETAVNEQAQFDQEMADIDWQMSMAVHYRQF